MTKIGQQDTTGETSRSALHFEAETQKSIHLPDNGFVTDATLARDGQDLLLHTPDGRTAVIEGYFSAAQPPVLSSPEGAQLTPALVDSFVRYEGPVQYAKGPFLNDASPVGLVRELSGHATVTHTDGSHETLSIGAPIRQGDVIETDEHGAVSIRFIDESTFSVSANARLAIDEYTFDPGSTGGESNFSLLRGMFVFTSGLIGREDPDDVHINTPVGSIGIRGTTIIGHINPEGGSSITVTEGAIVVENGAGSVTLAEKNDTVTLAGYDAAIQYSGTLNETQIVNQYNVLRVVDPEFFTTMEATPAADAPETEDSAPTTQPEPPAPQQQMQDGATDPVLTNIQTAFDGTADIFTDPAAQTTNETLLPPPSPDSAILSPLPPPPDSGTVTAVSTASTTTVTAPPPSGTTTTVTATSTILDLLAAGAPGVLRFNGAAASGEHLGAAISSWGDFDGDGMEDFLIANDKTSGGQVFGFTGGLGVLGGIPASPTSAPRISGIGDFDGDGAIDYVAGAAASNIPSPGSGAATIFAASTVSLSGTAGGQQVGRSVAGIGDIDGDGYNDVIIGAPGTAASAGAAYVVYGGTTNPSIAVSSMGSDGFVINGIATGDRLGSEVSAAGDFNRDGYADFLLSEPGQGRVHIAFGGFGIAGVTLGGGTMQINGISVDPLDKQIPVFSAGDFNGDGISDIAVGANNANGGYGEAYIIYGKSGYGGGGIIDVNTMTSADGIRIASATRMIDGGGAAGDFNGDGFDDVAIVMRTGNIADIYVVYGRAGVSNLNDAALNNTANAFHMSYNVGGAAAFKFEISSAGDTNGDGFGDLVIGTPDANGGDGGFIIVSGRANPADIASGKEIIGSGALLAAANGQALVGGAGNDALGANGHTALSFSAGAGNDIINIDNAGAIRSLDGGTGIDTLSMSGGAYLLNFANAGTEKISGVERFEFNTVGQTLQLGLDDVFRLMQDSDEIIGGRHTLKITNNAGGTTGLTIDDNNAGSGAFSAQAPGLGFAAAGTVTDGGVTYNAWNFGSGYQLLIDQNVNAVNVI